MNYEKYLETFTSQAAYSGIKKKYKVILENMDQGVYIWGTKRLGKFVEKQCKKNGIKIKGFIDNRMENSADNNIFLPSVVKKDDIIIIASISYWEIEQQIKSSELTENYLYYEILAKADERFEIYYAGFDGLFEDIERNKRKYIDILSVCEDNASYEVLGNVLMYRMTLDDSYIEKAYNLSILSGEQDFDNSKVPRIISKGA